MDERPTVDRRAAAMAERLAASARRHGVAETDSALADRFLAVVAARAIADPEDPQYLHPARNALILIEDLAVTDAVEASAAMGLDGDLPPRLEGADQEVVDLLARVPRGIAPDALLESLIVAPAPVRRILLVDRLDLARHLHLGDSAVWTTFHQQTRDAWLPAAERTHKVLARRLRWWTSMFERRWLPRVRA